MSVHVRLEDSVDGDTQELTIEEGEYFIITCQPCMVSSTQLYPKSGKAQVWIEGCRTVRDIQPKPVETEAR